MGTWSENTLNIDHLAFMSDTAANWTSKNPTLLAGELGIESDTLKIKVGDGSSTWTALSYATITPQEIQSGNIDTAFRKIRVFTSTSATTENTTVKLLEVPTSGKKLFPAILKIRLILANSANVQYLQKYLEGSFRYHGQSSTYGLESMAGYGAETVKSAGGEILASENAINIKLPTNGTSVAISIYGEIEQLSHPSILLIYTLNTDKFKFVA